MIRYLFFILVCVIFPLGLKAQAPSIELRGVWVASIANIDWPSKAGLSKKEQKNEIIEILDYYQALNFNAVFVQIRPSADVFYKSKLEPWSRYLTGEQGKKPHYDPLKFWIKESHKRGIEFHAWINPYRITQNTKEKLVPNHPAIKNPSWVFNYGGKLYYNPGVPNVRKFLNNVVSEIVNNYEVDGIHFDDYFYPYPIASEIIPDSLTYARFNPRKLELEDWRRDNVNKTINELGRTIKRANSNIKFGISPFGVWRNKADDERGSITNAGVTNYDHLYADVLTWLSKDWIDYITPQIYWTNENKAVPYNHLVDWWANNSGGKDVYIGHAIYKVDSKDGAWRDSNQIPLQIAKARQTEGVKGSIYFRHKFILDNKLGVADSLQNLYKYPALLPVCIKSKQIQHAAPYQLKEKKGTLKWKYTKGDNKYFAVYAIREGGVRQLIQLANKKKCPINNIINEEVGVIGIQITGVDYGNQESRGSEILFFK